MTKYYFWVSIFLVFFAAISRVSFFGFLYLLLCFVFVYRGQNMLLDRHSTRTKRFNCSCYVQYFVVIQRCVCGNFCTHSGVVLVRI